jgi:uncharacterized membrane-anchored protein YhcB (DUF1043 family)
MRNYDFGQAHLTKKVELTGKFRRRELRRKIVRKVRTIKYSIPPVFGSLRKWVPTLGSKAKSLDWRLLLKLAALAILVSAIAVGFTLKHQSDLRLQKIQDDLLKTQQELDKSKNDLKQEQDELKKQLEDTKSLITKRNEEKKQQQLYLAAVYIPKQTTSGYCNHNLRTATAFPAADQNAVRSEIARVYSPAGANAVRIATATFTSESGLRSNACSSTNDWGVGQVNRTAHPQYSVEWLMDYRNNIQATWLISNQGTYWGAWTDYRNGNYLAYY